MVAKWEGATYFRKRSNNWRNANNGAIFTNNGTQIGWEPKGKHFFGNDPRKRPLRRGEKKPKFR